MAFVVLKKCLKEPKQLLKLIVLIVCICVASYQVNYIIFMYEENKLKITNKILEYCYLKKTLVFCLFFIIVDSWL